MPIRRHLTLLLSCLALSACTVPSIADSQPADVDQPNVDVRSTSAVGVDVDVVVAPVEDIDAFGISYSFPGNSEPGSWGNNQVGVIPPRLLPDGGFDNIMFASGSLVAQMRSGLVSQGRLISHGRLSLIDGRESDFTPELSTSTEAQIRLRIKGPVNGGSIGLHVTVTAAYDRTPHEIGTCIAIRRGLSREILPGGSLVLGGILTKDGRSVFKRQPVLSTYFEGCHIGSRNVSEPSEGLMIFITPHVDSPISSLQ